MKIAVIGAGIFGISAAIKLAQEGYRVDLYELNSAILMAASGVNQYRLHRGYHYPRSKSTALSCRHAEDSFREEYAEALIEQHDHYYAVARNQSKVSGEKFIAFCRECNLEHEEVTLDDYLSPQMVDKVIKGKEFLIDPIRLEEVALQKIKDHQINLLLDTEFKSPQVNEYEKVVNCTYANSNFLLANYPDARREYQFELCEKPVLRLPQKFRGKSMVVMDGPFFCIDPYSTTDLHVMGNVVHAIHVTNTGYFPIIPDRFKSLLNKGILKNPKITNIEKFLEVATQFMPDMKDAEHMGSMFTIRTVLPNVDSTDERPTLVTKVTHKLIQVFSGKIGNCVEAAYEVARLIRD